MNISKGNRDDLSETYERLSIELANHFYYFGKILITVIVTTVLTQKISFIVEEKFHCVEKRCI